MSGLTNVCTRTVGTGRADGANRCHYDSTSTPGSGLPIASPLTWLSKTRPTWQIDRTGRSGARTVLRNSCIPSSSPVGCSRLEAKPHLGCAADFVRVLRARPHRLSTPHSPARSAGSYSPCHRGCLPPASLSATSIFSILHSTTARTDREETEQGGRR
jgi:hypothetical protein